MQSRTALHPHLRAHFPKVRAIAEAMARKQARHGGSYDDLVAEAMLGVVEASARYSPEHGASLTTFAWMRMQGRVRDHGRKERAHHVERTDLFDAPLEAAPRTSERLRNAIDVHNLVADATPNLDTDQRVVLREVHLGGETLARVSERMGWSPQQGTRRNRALLARLRQTARGADLRAHAVP